MNGVFLSSVDGVTAADTGAAPTQSLVVGVADNRTTFLPAGNGISSLCIIASALTDAQVLEDAKGCLPWLN